VTIIANSLNTPVYIVHVSCEKSADAIAKARASGWRVYGEALAGHLTIDDSVYFKGSWAEAARYVMSPPFRPAGNQEALWRALQSGVLQTTATDNCTFCDNQKAMGKVDFTKIPNGTNGVEDRMSILWHHGVNSGKITQNEFVAITSTNAAKIFNMYPRKGVIDEGSDADITVIDPTVSRVISAKTHWQAIDSNIFEGWQVTGVTVITISQGEVVWQAHVENGIADWKKGQFNLVKGRGKYLGRPTFGHPYEGLKVRESQATKKAVSRNH